MFPNANAPVPSQPWVRNVTERADTLNRQATRTESNAYALANSAKTSYELIDDRITNIDTFTTGLFEQDMHGITLDTYAEIQTKPILYQYASGNFDVIAAVTRRIPFSKYNELTVTAGGSIHSYTTAAAATDISIDKPVLPMVMATIPAMDQMNPDGSFTTNAFGYDSRWTVENFESFLDYDIPGNLVPSAYTSTNVGSDGFYPRYSTTLRAELFVDGWTSYAMKYTREWLMDYMIAIRDYSMENFPPSNGGILLPPDVNRVEIVLGFYYQPYTNPAPTNSLFINDNRLVFTSSNTFILEGIRNMGY